MPEKRNEKLQKQEVNTRQNLEKLTSDHLWETTITEEVRSFKGDLNRTNTKLNDVYARLGAIDERLTAHTAIGQGEVNNLKDELSRTNAKLAKLNDVYAKLGAIDERLTAHTAIGQGEVNNLKSAFSKMRADINDVCAKLDTIDKRLTSYDKISQRQPFSDKLVLFRWVVLFIPIGIFLFFLGSLSGLKIFSNDQQSEQGTSTHTQESSTELSKSSQESRQEPGLAPPSTLKEPTTSNPRQEEVSRSKHQSEQTTTPESVNPPAQESSSQVAPQPEISTLLTPPAEAPSSVPQPSVPRSIIQKWQGICNQVDPTDSYPMVLYIEKVDGSHFIGKLQFQTLDNTITEVEGEFVSEFGDVLEQSKWSHIGDFSNSRDGTWLKFTETRISQGGNLGPRDYFLINTWYYAHIRSNGSMVGVLFAKKEDSTPKGDFSLSQVSN